MKKLAIAISIVAFSAVTASAADMAVKAPYAPPPPVLSWAGFYIGGHGGYGWKDDPFSQTISQGPPPVFLNGFQSRGWVAGGQVGYNWQYAAFVGGVELDVSATGIKGNSAAVSFQNGNQQLTEFSSDNVKLLGSARGRVGWAINSDWLLYATGGLGWERLDQGSTNTNIFVPSANDPRSGTSLFTSTTPVDLFGWVLGAGAEARLWGSNWIGRLEYLHYDFGHSRNSVSAITTGVFGTSNFTNTAGNQTIDVVRAGLSYKFGN